MSDFKLYNVKENYGFYNDIFKRLCCENNDVFEKQSKICKTKFVKRILVDIGHNNGYKVYANGLKDEIVEISTHSIFSDGKKFVNKEWLYDVHWYEDINDKFFTPKKLILACECEWAKGKKPSFNQSLIDIGYDFQKLLFCNAEEKLFIMRLSKISFLKELATYFKNAIELYENLPHSSKFTIVCFCLEDKNIYILQLIKCTR